jgi:hypothetical protein
MISDLVSTIIQVLTDYFQKHPVARGVTFAITGLVLLAGTGSVVYFFLFSSSIRIYDYIPILGLVLAPVFVLFLTSLSANPSIQIILKQDSELAPIRKEREEIRHRIKEKEPDIFDTIQLNLNQLSEYYTINKSQARNSFRASVTAIVIGFFTIIIGIWVFYWSKASSGSTAAVAANQNLGYLSVIGGVLLQFIGGAYFYLYNRSLIQLNFFFARLTVMQDTMLSIKLCDQISEPPTKTKILERLIFEIITRGASMRKELAEGTPRAPALTRRKAKARLEKEEAASTIANVRTPRPLKAQWTRKNDEKTNKSGFPE